MTDPRPIRGRYPRWQVLASWLDGTEATARAFYREFPADPDELIDVCPRQRNREVSNAN